MGAGEVVVCSGELADARAAQDVRKHGVRHIGSERFATRTLDVFHDAAADGCDLGVVGHQGFSWPIGAPSFPAASSFDDALESEHALAL
jgi:hypothetical protein